MRGANPIGVWITEYRDSKHLLMAGSLATIGTFRLICTVFCTVTTLGIPIVT
jgi:hypothetical protein